MVKVVKAKMNQISGKALAELFADTKDEVTSDTSKIYGWPNKYTIEEGSRVTVADGTVGYFRSDGSVGWTTSGGGGSDGGGTSPENPARYIDLDGDGEADTTATNSEVDNYVKNMWGN